MLEKIFTMINIIDWISYYLALTYKVDPSPVNNISDQVKKVPSCFQKKYDNQLNKILNCKLNNDGVNKKVSIISYIGYNFLNFPSSVN